MGFGYGISYNPMQTTTAAGTFNVESTGFIQGVTMDAPSVRNRLSGGVVSLNEALPMWGGMAVSEGIPTGYVTGTLAGPKALGGFISRATSVPGTAGAPAPITSFTVFDQAHHGLASPQSPVPLYAGGMSVHHYRLGTGARIPVACDPALAALQSGLINQPVSWDFAGQRLVPYTAAYAANAITAATYNNATGVATFTTATPHGLVPGNDYSVSGVTPAGYNGSVTATTGTTGSTLTANIGAGLNLANATAFGTLVAGGGALPVTVLEIAPTNCMTVVFSSGGFATWNRNGACALILI